jgi:biopolymer transport protein ExbD
MRFRTRLQTSNILIDLTPLVDVIFLMLIFFIITANILPFKSLKIESPRLNKDSMPLTTQLLVVMDAQNVIYLGQHKNIVDFASLKQQLQEEVALVRKHRPGAQPTIVLSVDRRVDYGNFLRLFSIAQECGSKIRLVYQPEDQRARYL